MKTSEILSILDREYPFCTAEEWDNCGLLVGDADSCVSKILVCLDASLENIRYASQLGCELLISHHPVIFKAKKRFIAGNAEYEAAKNNIGIISLHTNLDKAVGGVNDALCDALGLKYKKIQAPVCNGFLNIAEPDGEMSVRELVGLVKNRLGASVQYADNDEVIKKLGVCSGAGADFVDEAACLGCNAFLTGEAKYHEFLDAGASGIALICAGHFETEIPIVKALAEKLRGLLSDVEIFESDKANIIKTE